MLLAATLLALGTPAVASLKQPLRRSVIEQSWEEPRQTSPAEMVKAQVAIGWTPRPTEAPKDLLGRMLEPRMDGYTLGPRSCGFDSTDGLPITCIADEATCTYQSSHIGCCAPNEDCENVKRTCMDYPSSSAGSCNLPDDFHTLCCSVSDRPACWTWLLSTTGTDDEPDRTFTLFDCATSSGVGILLDYDPAWAATHSFASSSSSGARETNVDEDEDEADENGADEDEGDGGSSTPLGAIIGGTVGGVAGLALIGVALFFWMRRRRNRPAKTPDTNNSPPQPMVQHAPQSPHQSFNPSSPGGAAYPSGVPSSYQGYSPVSQPSYDQQHLSAYGQPGVQPYPPQQFQGQHPPQQSFQQGAYPQQYGAMGYQPVPSTSPPPQTTPSPGVKDGAHGTAPATELQAINPIGNESRRAELGPN